ncbi:MAG: DUF6174 domain-containing protein [Actinomycetia bacterium]|nr:DUF6174 domain-containing protein [Actinomycetes bacterium]
MRRIAKVAASIALLVVVGCTNESTTTSDPEPTGTAIAPTTLEQAKALWAQNAPESYQMLLTPTNTTVKDVRHRRDGPGPYTVDQLFTYIASSGAEVIDVDYDEALGYPQKIRVDYTVGATDDEACYTIKNLRTG